MGNTPTGPHYTASKEQLAARTEYVSTLKVAHTRDEFGTDRYFVEDMHGDWIEGPFDSSDLAWAEIARTHKETPV